jgi:hypothetical protein
MTSLRRARVYRNVELPQEWLGLEPFDALSVITLGWLLMLVNRQAVGWNALALVLAYVGLRLFKRRKPEGYSRSLLRFYLRRPFFSAAAPDREGARQVFLQGACRPPRRAEPDAPTRHRVRERGAGRQAPLDHGQARRPSHGRHLDALRR